MRNAHGRRQMRSAAGGQVLLLVCWLAVAPAAGLAALRARTAAEDGERGDIPGWVMIAIMSAAVVAVLIPLVGSTITKAFSTAINSVTNAKPNG